MDIPEDEIGALMAAGAGALTFNAPLSMERASALLGGLAELGAESIVDLGCGRGVLACMAGTGRPTTTVIGVDTDPDQIHAARKLAAVQMVEDRVEFVVGDAASWTRGLPSTNADAAICVGASHAFGGSVGMFNRLAAVVPDGPVMVGDSIWQTTPNDWCLDAFGELPAGAEALAEAAGQAGWSVVDASSSTVAEWDAFEGGWIAGVRAVGTEAATTFADVREQEYQQHYRASSDSAGCYCALEPARGGTQCVRITRSSRWMTSGIRPAGRSLVL